MDSEQGFYDYRSRMEFRNKSVNYELYKGRLYMALASL
jgi:hypothetical protein